MAAVEQRVQAQANQRHWIARLKEDREKVDAAKGRADLVQQEFEVSLRLASDPSLLCGVPDYPFILQNWTEKAEQFCARVENPRSVAEVDRDLAAVQKALREREKRYASARPCTLSMASTILFAIGTEPRSKR